MSEPYTERLNHQLMSLSLLASLAPDNHGVSIPINMTFLDTQELSKPYPTIRKQTDDALIPDIVCLFNQVLHLLLRQTRQYYLLHLGQVNRI